MKVLVVATGQVKDMPRDAVTARLIEAGVFEAIKEFQAPAPPTAPTGEATWGLYEDRDVSKGLTITAACDTCQQKIWGAPKATKEAVAKLVFWHCGVGAKVPENIANEYIQRGGGQAFPELKVPTGPGVEFLKQI
jgi:hypothetical protein